MNSCICEWCGSAFRNDDCKINIMTKIPMKDNFYELGLAVCANCFCELSKYERDLQDRITFPYDKQITLFKVKKYNYPPIKKKKLLESWKLFTTTTRKGPKVKQR